jgi:hypothetical protein
VLRSTPQNPALEVPEESRLLSLLANVLEAMVDATEQREHARLQARLQVGVLLIPVVWSEGVQLHGCFLTGGASPPSSREQQQQQQ